MKASNRQIMSTIRLTKTKKLESILLELQQSRFPLSDNTELIKAIISDYYSSFKGHSNTPSRMATPEEEILIKEGMDALESGITLSTNDGT